MKINGKQYSTIWENNTDDFSVSVIDQSCLPFEFQIVNLISTSDFITAIKDMIVRGAPLIGATGAYAVVAAVKENINNPDFNSLIIQESIKIANARPTAVNLSLAVVSQMEIIENCPDKDLLFKAVLDNARRIVEQDIARCIKIGDFGAKLIKDIAEKKTGAVNILTHCNAGWLAAIDHGTALSPIYKARDLGIDIHVWVDETRPRNQGARLTAFELMQENIDCTIIADNAGGLLMARNMVDIVIVGSDRVTLDGDVCNKIGTYLKALAAADNNIPFYAALPTSTIDPDSNCQPNSIEIEKRSQEELLYTEGFYNNEIISILTSPFGAKALNFGFDVTPARLVSGIITENGICKANRQEISKLINLNGYGI